MIIRKKCYGKCKEDAWNPNFGIGSNKIPRDQDDPLITVITGPPEYGDITVMYTFGTIPQSNISVTMYTLAFLILVNKVDITLSPIITLFGGPVMT